MKLRLNRVISALTLAATLMALVAMPVAGETESLQDVSIVPADNTAGSESVYTFTFTMQEDLPDEDTDEIFLTFPPEATLPGTVSPSDFLIENRNVAAGGVQPSGASVNLATNRITLNVPDPGLSAGEVVVTVGANGAIVTNPPTEGEYEAAVATTEETRVWDTFFIVGQPVVLFLKKQIPLAQCGYKDLVPVASYETIEEAVDAARDIWEQDPDRAPILQDYPRWNLFDGCPDLSAESETFQTAAGNNGVYVGAVIAVNAGTYVESVDLDVPGLVLGSVDGPASTIIELENVEPEVLETGVLTAGVAIEAGGVTLGSSEIYQASNDFGELTDLFELHGFTIQNAGQGTDTGFPQLANGVAISPTCSDVDVFSSSPAATGIVTDTGGVFEIESSTMISTSWDAVADHKVVNLTQGWSAYVIDGTDDAAVELTLTQPVDAADAITVTDYFTNGDYVAVFAPTAYTCNEARVDVRDNIINDSTWAGIYVETGAIWIDGNEIFDNATDGVYADDLIDNAVKVCDGSGEARADSELLEISNNNIHDNGDGAMADWLGDSDCFDKAISNGTDSGIQVDGVIQCQQVTNETLYINNNTLDSNAHAGLWLRDGAAACGVNVLWNDITNNGVFGVYNETTESTAGPTGDQEALVDFRYNDVMGNGVWGVFNDSADLSTPVWFNAKENYWGSWAGPSSNVKSCNHDFQWWQGENDEMVEHPAMNDVMGNGDDVSKGTFYDPWLTVESQTLHLGEPNQHIRAYGSELWLDAEGWNTLSVPLPLDGRANDLQELVELGTGAAVPGTFLVDAGGNLKFEKAYQYNGTWDSIAGTSPDDLEAVKGYYIKLLEATKFPVIYGKTWIELPENSLSAGWNLIGSGFGIDRDYETTAGQGRYGVADYSQNSDTEGQMGATMALNSIAPDSVGGGAAMFVNPGVPGQEDGFAAEPWAYGGAAPTSDMYTGEGYWVFMREPGVLAGFESAPLAFDTLPMR